MKRIELVASVVLNMGAQAQEATISPFAQEEVPALILEYEENPTESVIFDEWVGDLCETSNQDIDCGSLRSIEILKLLNK